MPLLPNNLYSSLAEAFDRPAPDRVTAAQAFADAYDMYTVTGLAAGLPMVYTTTEKLRMVAALTPAYVLPVGDPNTMAQAIAGAITMYWTGVFYGTFPAVPPTGAAALASTLAPVLANPMNTRETFLTQLTAALDLCTRTVVVTTPAGPVPVV
jgi:hypothetical protein